MTILKCIEKQFKSSVRKTCSDAGCTLKLNDLTDHIVLKGEEIFKGKPICDCIIFVKGSKLLAGVVELKSKTVDVSQVRLQLANGLKFVFETLKKCSIGSKPEPIKCYVIVLAKKWRKSEFNVIKNRKIEFQGKKYFILPKRCGTSLSDIISKF